MDGLITKQYYAAQLEVQEALTELEAHPLLPTREKIKETEAEGTVARTEVVGRG